MKRFLLVDDDDIFNFLNKKVLEKSNLASDIVIFTSAQKAIDYLLKTQLDEDQRPDILLLDIRMPGMDGFEFLNHIQEMSPSFLKSFSVYMLTSSIDERDKKRSESYPFVYGYFSKPLSPAILLQISSAEIK